MKALLISLVLMLIVCDLKAQKIFDEKVSETVSFSDNFTNNNKKWLEKKNDSVVAMVQNGIYYHVARATNIIAIQNPYVSLFNKNNYWKYSVETTYNEGGGFFGLAYGVKDAKNFNLFLINGNSDFMIVSMVDGKSEILLKGKSEKINKGKGAKNILTIQNDQNKYVHYTVSYSVNGSDIKEKTDKEQSLLPNC